MLQAEVFIPSMEMPNIRQPNINIVLVFTFRDLDSHALIRICPLWTKKESKILKSITRVDPNLRRELSKAES